MSLPRKRSKLRGDFLVSSFYGNMESVPRGQCRNLDRGSEKENSEYSTTSSESSHPQHNTNQRNKEKTFVRSPLKDKNIGDNSFVSHPKAYYTPPSSRTLSQFDDKEEEMETARNTSDHTMNNIESLRKKCVCLNFEFNQIQEQHGDYHAKQRSSNSEADEANFSDSSDITLEKKYTEVFKQPKPEMYKQQQSNGLRRSETKDKVKPCAAPASKSTNKDLKIVLKTLNKIFKATPIASRDSTELKQLYQTLKTVKEEQEHFRNLINSQQDQINNFHSKYLKAENIIRSQKYEIKQLNHTNTQLENELNTNINDLKEKLQDKINEVASLPQTVKAEKTKADKLSKHNCELIARLQEVKHELALTRSKLVEAAQKRTTTLNKLKSSEKDLKIFRNQNNILKTEKRTLLEELKRQKTLNDTFIAKCSKNISRQKERSESQQRLLQKKILDLELELTRSRNSTSDLIEERDKLIAELHQQLNTLVHNFEVSQKHIRVLRKHIHSMSGTAVVPPKA